MRRDCGSCYVVSASGLPVMVPMAIDYHDNMMCEGPVLQTDRAITGTAASGQAHGNLAYVVLS
jgi:hypothetical protein